MDLKNPFFFKLPVEIIETIFYNLSAIDISSFVEAYPQYAKITANFTNLDLSNQYELDDFNGFLAKGCFIFKNIVTLNINGIYWISVSDLRETLLQFINLKNLYAINTRLSIYKDDLALYKRLNIKKLAVSFEGSLNDVQLFFSLPTLRAIYLYSSNELNDYDDKLLDERVFSHAKSIWTCEFYNNTHRCCRLTPEHSVENTHKLETTNPHWDKLLGCTSCFHYKDIERIRSGQIHFDFIHLQELALTDPSSHCRMVPYTTTNCDYIDLGHRVLLTPQVKRLRKLAVNSCFLYYGDEKQEPMKYLFTKRPKLSEVPIDADNSIGKLIFQHLNGLQVLEIVNHESSCSHSLASMPEYRFIGLCKNLKRLKIDFAHCYSSFLPNVLRQCTLIEQLILMHNLPEVDDAFASNLLSIQFAENLKDFTYANKNISSDEFSNIMNGLCLIKSKNLKRIYIDFPTDMNFGKENGTLVEKFLPNHSQLIFFCLNCKSPDYFQQIKKLLKTFQKRPAQYFTTYLEEAPSPLRIHPHLFDLIRNVNTAASSTHIEDFYKLAS